MMEFISAKEARELTDLASTAKLSKELERINREIKNAATKGCSQLRVDFYYGTECFLETAKKAPAFFEALGFSISNKDDRYYGNYWFTISW